MNNITSYDFTQSLPPSLQSDSTMLSLAKVVTEELTTNLNLVKKATIYPHIDELPENVLDVIAVDLNIKWYDKRYGIETKRSIIKESVKVHKYLGTKYAVETALRSVYPNCKVAEWFEYNGTPCKFKVYIYDSTNDTQKRLITIEKIQYYKNLRSHIDAIVYSRSIEGQAKLYTGAKVRGKYKKIKVEVKNYGME